MILLVIALAGADCASCHPREAETLALSRHAIAAQLPVFVEPARTANAKWCASCHQPEGPRTTGLQCLSCHRVTGDPDAVRAARLLPTTATRSHRTIVDTQFAITACAGCHEFATPLPASLDRGPVRYSEQPLQSTVSELRATDPKATCASCHDVHRGNGAHDASLVRGAAQWSARVVGDDVEVTAVASAIGHRFPTGDPFRRIVVAICSDEACRDPIATRTIDRRFGLAAATPSTTAPQSTAPQSTALQSPQSTAPQSPQSAAPQSTAPQWARRIDTTLRDRERRVLRFDGATSRARYWRVELRYGDPKYESRLPASEVAIELARGELVRGPDGRASGSTSTRATP